MRAPACIFTNQLYGIKVRSWVREWYDCNSNDTYRIIGMGRYDGCLASQPPWESVEHRQFHWYGALDWRSFDLPPFLSLKWLSIGTRPFFPQKKLSNGAPLLRFCTSVVGLPAPLSASPQEALVLCLWLPIIPMNPTILGSVRVLSSSQCHAHFPH